ncbi:MAG: BMP family ABC transporter substrate-binding protein [Solibacillus sp.]
MKKIVKSVAGICLVTTLAGCGNSEQSLETIIAQAEDNHFSVGVLLPDVGLGDQSFNDLAVNGLVRARDELDILWSYRDATNSASLEAGLHELLEQHHDLIIGVGYTTQEVLENVADDYPDQQFVIVDSASDLENIDSITFKEDEGSFLAGAIAAKASKTGVLGFVGGMEDPVILKFLEGYRQGAQSVNPAIEVLVSYANTYSDDKIGAQLARDMIEQNADVLYAAAGYTGVGLLQEAQRQGVYAIGVDNDQYFYAEKAVITSMTKNIDVAVYNYVQNYIENKPTTQQIVEFGIADDGVALAPIRVLDNAIELEQYVQTVQVKLNN